MPAVNDALIEGTEFRLLLDGILDCYGYDFRDYDMAPLKRRIWDRVHAEGAQTLSGYQEKILHEPACMEQLLLTLRDDETGFFEEPLFWQTFRTIVVPMLRTYPAIQIWVPECAGGQDLFSLAILLQEEGLQHRARIYATDLSEAILKQTRTGVFPLDRIGHDTESYLQAGGRGCFSDYYHIEQDHARVNESIMEPIVFAEHNLGTDGPFHLFQAIVCRRALTAFNEWLQERVQGLFTDSLSRFGVLAMGESDCPKPLFGQRYEPLPGIANLYRKVE
ncbi:MAG TPA: CheR family methyltransferase [Nitrospirales bacterium]